MAPMLHHVLHRAARFRKGWRWLGERGRDRIGMKRRCLGVILVAMAACPNLVGCSAHDVVKPNVDEGAGGAGGSGSDAGSADGGDETGVPSADCSLAGIWITKSVTVSQA